MASATCKTCGGPMPTAGKTASGAFRVAFGRRSVACSEACSTRWRREQRIAYGRAHRAAKKTLAPDAVTPEASTNHRITGG